MSNARNLADLSVSVTTDGSVTANALTYTGALTGSTGVLNIGSGQIYKYANGSIGLGTSNPVGLLNLRGYTGGTAGSAVSSYTKTLVIGGTYNQSYNSANAVLMHVCDYSNDGGDNVYPIYCEDENNVIDFYISAGSNGLGSDKKAYFGGNVGIGTSSPANKLHVYGDGSASLFKVQASNSNGTASINLVPNGNGNGQIYTETGALLFSPASTERMRLDSSGKLGIGTTSPQFLVSANQNSSSGAPSVQVTPQFYAKGYAGAAQKYAGIGFAMYEHTNGYWGSGILAYDDTGSYGSALTFYTSSGSNTPSPTECMRIDSSGRVTKPYQTSFSAYSNDGTNISGANIKLTMYTGVSFNIGNNYNSTTCRYTAPISGVYFFRAQAWAHPGTTLSGLSIRVNGNQKACHRWAAATSVPSQYNTLVPTLIIKLTAGDYVELYTSVEGGSIHPSTGENYSNFSGYLLG